MDMRYMDMIRDMKEIYGHDSRERDRNRDRKKEIEIEIERERERDIWT